MPPTSDQTNSPADASEAPAAVVPPPTEPQLQASVSATQKAHGLARSAYKAALAAAEDLREEVNAADSAAQAAIAALRKFYEKL